MPLGWSVKSQKQMRLISRNARVVSEVGLFSACLRMPAWPRGTTSGRSLRSTFLNLPSTSPTRASATSSTPSPRSTFRRTPTGTRGGLTKQRLELNPRPRPTGLTRRTAWTRSRRSTCPSFRPSAAPTVSTPSRASTFRRRTQSGRSGILSTRSPRSTGSRSRRRGLAGAS